ncbi:MAG: molybdopterin-dependent oxidoreductase [Vicinamibacterales bacterium]|jgi:DMSO/TMAO reductase YedYZ molybdopterin-dependent catalytic subunit|nr:molybdopterin-dependent oxidoreductase [Vicinamibacterales bacterium]MDP7479361.1 molybdopterin-dependent oxidoreductase [Vicinamibacterales bacterium]MDP7693559.1 molybdopterin-dependent oxidoreductase [Vicinamibacterales bacterium]HJN43390.1 molybdopterin-dependent oxidoreductase [Vicinamibacterales bacterium]|tara:strand:+ start:450 stop:1235 length:786 start_codon:yes stop_codon:yes gene_type:complete
MNKKSGIPERSTGPSGISRRRLLASVPALGGLLATGCSEAFRPPVIRGGLVGAADVLTMSTTRWLLADQPLAREYTRADIAPNFPTWGQTNPSDEAYQQHLGEGFANWSLSVGGLVERPRSFSLDELKRLASRTQITAHVCEQGWSAIGEWTGAPLAQVLEAAGGVTSNARYVVFESADGWYESIDMFEVVHPQTILAYGLNGDDLPVGNGAPLRLRVERQCGYKNIKFVSAVRVVDSLAGIRRGTGGLSSDFGFHWYGGV